LPDHVIPIAYLCLGYVDEFAQKPDLEIAGWLSRLDLKDVIFFEKWNNKESIDWSEIQNMIKTNFDTLK